MERYKLGEKLGDGTFGTVWKAVHLDSGDVVAIKRMKRGFKTWEECLGLKEVESLRKLRHPAIVRLREVVREAEQLFLVFEFVGMNLYQLMKDRSRHFPEASVRSWLRQALQGLAHLHATGYFHRDIKPENLLVRGDVIKLADLGLVRPIDSAPPYTEYVSTRWYRAPEVLLRAPAYGPPVDMFALGAVAAEVYSLKPLFPGGSEADQLACICGVLGSPTEASWAGGLRLAERVGFAFVPTLPTPLAELLPTASPAAVHLVASLCAWDPAKRPTAAEALQLPYFQEGAPPPPLRSTAALRERLHAAAAKLEAASAQRAAERQQQPAEAGHAIQAADCTAAGGGAAGRAPLDASGAAHAGAAPGGKAGPEPLRRLSQQAAGRQRLQLRQHRAQAARGQAKGMPRTGSEDAPGSAKIGTRVHK